MKMRSLKLISVLTFTFATFVIGTANADIKANREAVNAACSQDAATAGCGTKTVGKGLLKCLHAYKKEHKEFAFSDGCKSAMKNNRSERKERKEKK